MTISLAPPIGLIQAHVLSIPTYGGAPGKSKDLFDIFPARPLFWGAITAGAHKRHLRSAEFLLSEKLKSMSIRYLAVELYKAIKKVEDLEAQLRRATRENRGEIEARLFAARREQERLRKTLEAKKE